MPAPERLHALLTSPAAIRLQRAVLPTLLRAPTRVLARLSGGLPVIDGQQLDAQTAFLIAQSERAGVRPFEACSLPEARRQLEMMSRVASSPFRPLPVVEDLVIATSAGPLPARRYAPSAHDDALPLCLFFHGGGFTLGSLESHDSTCRDLAELARVVVLAVDYRLAPEHRFPAAADDAIAAYRWALANADLLHADTARIAVAGDSAGGNLAAGVCHAARDAGLPVPTFQLLIYPAVDARRQTASSISFARGFMLEAPTMAWFEAQYFGRDADRDDARASPLRAPSFAGLPPAYVQTAGFDPLRDEGRAYADALERAGVPVRYSCRGGLVHGYLAMSGAVTAAREAVEDAAQALAAGLAPRRGRA